jgi:catechol 2,3-dioxygenase-like lactoylglutathione lyase family enzyme
MRPHLSLDVRNIHVSVEYYHRVFGVPPQKRTVDYATFDLTEPNFNLSLVASTGALGSVNHLGIEVASTDELATWQQRLQEQGILEKVEEDIACFFARQGKLWFTDPGGNAWEIFTVPEQLTATGSLKQTGCCVPKGNGTTQPATCVAS